MYCYVSHTLSLIFYALNFSGNRYGVKGRLFPLLHVLWIGRDKCTARTMWMVMNGTVVATYWMEVVESERL
jgi:hypothetical protein